MNETERRAKAGVYEAINWNEIEDNYDKQTWEKLNSQFWTATRVPVSNDLDDWRTLDPVAKDLYGKVFGGLTLLDTLQSQDGMLSLLNNETQSPHMRAVLSNMLFMEAIHAQSYSTIFSTLMTPQEITNVFDFTHTNEHLQKKAHIINEVYQNGTVPQKMIASVFLESGLFYSGFYTPLYYLGNGKMANVAEVIRLILRDESVHGTYLGLKYQMLTREYTQEQRDELQTFAIELLYKLYTNEMKYTEYLYDEIGWTADVKAFVRYNLNKALANLGMDAIYPERAQDVNPIVMTGLSTESSNHDFFSQVGNSYVMGKVQSVSTEDYDLVNALATRRTQNKTDDRSEQ